MLKQSCNGWLQDCFLLKIEAIKVLDYGKTIRRIFARTVCVAIARFCHSIVFVIKIRLETDSRRR